MVADRIQALTEELVNEETMTQQKDPLVALKQQELDLRAMDMQRRGEEFNVEEIRKRQEFMERMNLEQMERDDANAQAKERIRVADEKLDIAAKKVTGGK
jgi:acetyl-CoA acetyltransferase